MSEIRKYFFVALNTGFVVDRHPDRRCFEFYSARSGNGLHCAIVGNVVIPGGIGTNDNTAEISDDPSWGELAHSITARGAVAGVQLATAWPSYRGMKNFVSRESAQEKIQAQSELVQLLENQLRAARDGSELQLEEMNAQLQRERLERTMAEGALEAGRKDIARLLRELAAMQYRPLPAEATGEAPAARRLQNAA